MRISHKYNQPLWLECRSDKNGPLEYAQLPIIGDGAVPDRLLPYKVAKPYTRADVRLDHLVPAPIPAGVSLIELPTAEQVVSSLLSSRPTLASSVFQPFVDTAGIQNSALQNAIEYGNILLLVSMKEAGETIDMVYHVFVRLWKVITKMIHSARHLNLAVTIDTLSDLWLEYRYGWRPFFGEISSIAKQLAHVRNPNVLSSYGGQLEQPTRPSFEFVTNIAENGLIANVRHTVTPRSDISAKLGFNYCNHTNSRNSSTLALWGLDWHSLASTAWDLVPFSFVVDMFLNVSDILRANGVEDEVKAFNGYISFTGEFDVVSKITSVTSSLRTTMRDYLSPSELIALGSNPYFAGLYKLVEDKVHRQIFGRDGSLRVRKGAQYMNFNYSDKIQDKASALTAYKNMLHRENRFPVSWTIDPDQFGKHSRAIFYRNFWDEELANELFATSDGSLDFDLRVISIGHHKYSFREMLVHIVNIGNSVLEANYTLRFKVYEIGSREDGNLRFEAHCHYDYSGSEKVIDLNGEEPSYSYSMSTFQRVLNSEVKHTIEASSDLSVGQYTDLAAIGWNLVQSFRK